MILGWRPTALPASFGWGLVIRPPPARQSEDRPPAQLHRQDGHSARQQALSRVLSLLVRWKESGSTVTSLRSDRLRRPPLAQKFVRNFAAPPKPPPEKTPLPFVL